MGQESYNLGQQGETVAEAYLSDHGYEILEKNFRSHQGEIDIIAQDGDFLVFIEVKNYSLKNFMSPLGAITKNKRNSIIHAARVYLYRHKIKDTFCRFDVLTISRAVGGSQKIDLYKNAFVA